MAKAVYPARMINLILSDVIGDHLDMIASGPTTPDTTTYQDALEILNRYGILDDIPKSIKEHLELGICGGIPETPKPGNEIFNRVSNLIIGNNYLAASRAEQIADEV